MGGRGASSPDEAMKLILIRFRRFCPQPFQSKISLHSPRFPSSIKHEQLVLQVVAEGRKEFAVY